MDKRPLQHRYSKGICHQLWKVAHERHIRKHKKEHERGSSEPRLQYLKNPVSLPLGIMQGDYSFRIKAHYCS